MVTFQFPGRLTLNILSAVKRPAIKSESDMQSYKYL